MVDPETGRWYKVLHFMISKSWDGWQRNGKWKFIGFWESEKLNHFVFWRLLISWEKEDG